jgi:glycerophosphoryl diester phosphodiesterase
VTPVRKRKLVVVGLVLLAVWLNNTSLFHDGTPGATRLVAHRGVHQTFSIDGVDRDTCTATRIDPPRHRFIENTLPSMQAAFEAGADVVEIDVHLTPDGALAVFHDWTLDCRTNARGVTEATPMDQLRAVDVGHGYSADGVTFPLRGQGIGLMPTLDEVFAAFPNGRFLVNLKSTRAEEGEAVAARVASQPAWRAALWGVYGGGPPTERALARVPHLRGYTKESLARCLAPYVLVGWTGHVPDACRGTVVHLPRDLAPLFWGWPHRFTARLRAVGSVVVLGGAARAHGTSGIDDIAAFDEAVPVGFEGYVWTNRIEIVGPHLRARKAAP